MHFFGFDFEKNMKKEVTKQLFIEQQGREKSNSGKILFSRNENAMCFFVLFIIFKKKNSSIFTNIHERVMNEKNEQNFDNFE